MLPPKKDEQPDTGVLQATLRRTRRLRRAARDALAPDEATAPGALRETEQALGVQEAVLTRLVRAAGGSTRRGGTRGSQDLEAVSASEPAAAEQDLGARLVQTSLGPTVRDELVVVSGANLPTLMALHGQRVAAAQQLGEQVRWHPLTGPTGSAAVTILAGLRQAGYGLEVLAARSTGDERADYVAAVSTLRALTRAMTEAAGPAAPVAPLGYDLPSELSSQSQRRRLAQDLLTALSEAIMAGSSARAGHEEAISGTVHLVAVAVRLGSTFELAMSAFPGLDVPATSS